jgi:hypothetical protein
LGAARGGHPGPWASDQVVSASPLPLVSAARIVRVAMPADARRRCFGASHFRHATFPHHALQRAGRAQVPRAGWRRGETPWRAVTRQALLVTCALPWFTREALPVHCACVGGWVGVVGWVGAGVGG